MIACTLFLHRTAKILEKRGLTPKGEIQKRLDEEVEMKCRPYVPRKEGFLEQSGTASFPSIGFVQWDRPYAKYQYYGYLMLGKKTKVLTGIPLKSRGGGLRGSRWFERMKIDCLGSIVKTLAQLAGGKEK